MRTDPGRTPATLEKLGDKLTRKVWDAVVCNDRRLARLCALDSPAAAAIRLYGPSGAAWAVGISPTERLAAVAGATTASSGLHQTSNGYVETAAGHRFPFLLRWQAAGSAGLIDEILPYDFRWSRRTCANGWRDPAGRVCTRHPNPGSRSALSANCCGGA